MTTVNGFRIQAAIKALAKRRDYLESRFRGSLFAFPGDEKPDSRKLMADCADAEAKIAALQVAQARYNLAVDVDVQGTRMTLLEAVKRVGGASRAEKKWAEGAKDEEDSRYGRNLVRDKDSVVARRTVAQDECAEAAQAAAAYAGALRAAIQTGNAKEVELDIDLDI